MATWPLPSGLTGPDHSSSRLSRSNLACARHPVLPRSRASCKRVLSGHILALTALRISYPATHDCTPATLDGHGPCINHPSIHPSHRIDSSACSELFDHRGASTRRIPACRIQIMPSRHPARVNMTHSRRCLSSPVTGVVVKHSVPLCSDRQSPLA